MVTTQYEGDDHEKMLNFSHKRVTVKVKAEGVCNESPGECDKTEDV